MVDEEEQEVMVADGDKQVVMVEEVSVLIME